MKDRKKQQNVMGIQTIIKSNTLLDTTDSFEMAEKIYSHFIENEKKINKEKILKDMKQRKDDFLTDKSEAMNHQIYNNGVISTLNFYISQIEDGEFNG